MFNQQLVQDFQDFLVKVLPEVTEELVGEGFLTQELSPEKMTEAVKEAIYTHGKMQLFNVKVGVVDVELDKTVTHILANKGEFKRYLKNKIVFA